MSGGLYSTAVKDFDKTLDLTKVKPYGDTMNDSHCLFPKVPKP